MKLSIRAKLFIGFGALLALLASIGILMTNKLSESNDRLNSIVTVSGKKVNLSHEILIALLDITRQEKNAILESNSFQKQAYVDRLRSAEGMLEDKIRELEPLVTDKGADDLNRFRTAYTSFRLVLDSTLEYSVNGETEKAFALSSGRGRDLRESAIGIINGIIDRNNARIAEDQLDNEKSYDASSRLLVSLLVIGLLLVVAVTYWIIQTIVARINFIAHEAEKIASREFSDAEMKDNTRDELSAIFNSLVNTNNSFREVTLNAHAVANGNYDTDFRPRSDKDQLGHALKKVTISLRETTAANERHNWLTIGQNKLNEKLRGDQSVEELSGNMINFLCSYLDANVGAVYMLDERSGNFHFSGGYAVTAGHDIKTDFAPGEGLIGQAAREQKLLVVSGVDEEDIRISSSVLHARPRHLLVSAFRFERNTLGVAELGRLTAFTETEIEFIGSVMETIGVSVYSAMARKKIQQLLEETQVQSEELQSQQEELKQVNEELEEQAQNLKQQQEELQMTNEELEEQTQSLEMKNREVEAARADIEQKTKQLELSSKYKSEFLANMSHELRTPLNSLLILSKDLSENKKLNLDRDQVESAEIIYRSGHELLNLINEVLDLSKIEAGKMSVNVERVALRNFTDNLLRDFRHQAEKKSLKLNVSLALDLPESIRTDAQRLNQIMKNLLSNALKFTDRGSVSVSIQRHDQNRIMISVTDTGIGIPEDKQMAIFEAFQQADGGTSRKYGGTGLGLSISRELARLLNAEIRLQSTPGQGSVFSLIIPIQHTRTTENTAPGSYRENDTAPEPASHQHSGFLNYPALPDDRDSIKPEDKIVLVIEDDLKFAGILFKLAREKGFRCLSAATGEDGLVLARNYQPSAILLDIDLPGMSGRHVLSELKNDPAVRHIPVHVVSVNERSIEPIKAGAIEYLVKPVAKEDLEAAFNRIEGFVSRKMKNLLIIEDDQNARKAMRKLIGNGDVKCLEAGSGEEALNLYETNHIDCIVLDIGLPDINGFELIYRLEKFQSRPVPPIIIYTGKELSREENEELHKYAESIIIKGVRSEERLLDETALFLHRTIGNLPESKRNIISSLYDKEAAFNGKKILLVDDDMRNIFALSRVLKERSMNVVKAENGKAALDMLATEQGIDLVLMDIMMPEMDGYEAMQKIRAQQKFKKLPIIALTAKAMKDDKQKCIDAGASDYITKPVDVERLLTLMRVWLSR